MLATELNNLPFYDTLTGLPNRRFLLDRLHRAFANSKRVGQDVVRLGGDEFVVMLEDLSQRPLEAAVQAKVVGDKILAAINKPFLFATRSDFSTAKRRTLLMPALRLRVTCVRRWITMSFNCTIRFR